MNNVPRHAHTIRVLEPNQEENTVFPEGIDIVKTERKIKGRKNKDHNITFTLKSLDTYFKGWKDIHHDLLLVSGAVEFADHKHKKCVSRGWVRDFSVTIPVFEPKIWRQDTVQQSLCAALKHLTGDNWQFSFTQWHGDPLAENQQRGLHFDSDKKQSIIAYSDGIDSFCVSKLCDDGDKSVRVRLVANGEKSKKDDQPFDQIPFNVRVDRPRESSVRSRGFKFAVITAIAAHISGAETIVVPESGQGAIGPVLLPSHNTYADYRNYPTYFRKMEKFIKAVLGHQVSYKQPRLWSTKGETIKDFLSIQRPDKPYDDLIATRSCWQVLWNVFIGGKRKQCGLCPACLLRRMSMHTAGIEEPVENIYFFFDLTAERYLDAMLKDNDVEPNESIIEYGVVGARRLQQLANMAKLPDEELRIYAFELAEATKISKEEALNKLRTLLQNHAEEWDDFLRVQGEKTFLRRWIKGLRDD